MSKVGQFVYKTDVAPILSDRLLYINKAVQGRVRGWEGGWRQCVSKAVDDSVNGEAVGTTVS
jgi:hypothetical protein